MSGMIPIKGQKILLVCYKLIGGSAAIRKHGNVRISFDQNIQSNFFYFSGAI